MFYKLQHFEQDIRACAEFVLQRDKVPLKAPPMTETVEAAERVLSVVKETRKEKA